MGTYDTIGGTPRSPDDVDCWDVDEDEDTSTMCPYRDPKKGRTGRPVGRPPSGRPHLVGIYVFPGDKEIIRRMRKGMQVDADVVHRLLEFLAEK